MAWPCPNIASSPASASTSNRSSSLVSTSRKPEFVVGPLEHHHLAPLRGLALDQHQGAEPGGIHRAGAAQVDDQPAGALRQLIEQAHRALAEGGAALQPEMPGPQVRGCDDWVLCIVASGARTRRARCFRRPDSLRGASRSGRGAPAFGTELSQWAGPLRPAAQARGPASTKTSSFAAPDHSGCALSGGSVLETLWPPACKSEPGAKLAK